MRPILMLATLSVGIAVAPVTAQGAAAPPPSFDDLVAVTHPAYSDYNRKGHLVGAVIAGCTLTLTLDSKQTVTVPLGLNTVILSVGELLTMTLSGADGSAKITFEGGNASRFASMGEDLLTAANTQCGG